MFTKLQKAVYLYPVQCINWLLWEPEFQMLFDGCLHNTTMSACSILYIILYISLSQFMTGLHVT